MLKHGDDQLYGDDTWEKAVDSAVYVSAGLRMPGSIKVSTCSNCEKQTRATCGECAGTGRVDENRPYTFYAAFDKEGNEDEEYTRALSTSFLKLVIFSSIRSHETSITKHFKRFVGAPSFVHPTVNRKKRPSLGHGDELPEDRKA
eukprot:417530-Pleurochrysis_carterae.AAC.1